MITMGFGLDCPRGVLMKLRRLRQDLDHLNSWLLLAVTAGTIVTGLVVHLWDLHGFTWHTYLGYALIVAVVVHFLLNHRQLFAYTGFRLRRGLHRVRGGSRPAPPTAPEPRGVADTTRKVLLSRRGLVGLALGGAGGYLLGHGLRPPPTLERGSDLGLVYHQWSSEPGMIDAVGALANLGRQPPLYKSYDDAVRLALPPAPTSGGLTVETALARRQSSRAYSVDPMTAQELSRVLLLTAGLSSGGRRHHPSSGALYPIETYTVVHNVTGVESGVYHYNSENHLLDQVRAGDFRSYVVEHGLNQQFLGECAVVLYLTMIFQRMRFKYGERSYRYGLIEAGHLGQNLYLAATSIGLGACAVGAYDDQGIDQLLGIDGREEVSVYLLSLGRV
jgi:SagB-type dehydrogenase family enzyme